MVFHLNFKQLVVVHIILILILSGLIIKIKSQEKDYNCESCIITFKKWMYFGEEKNIVEFDVPLKTLYKGYIKGECPIEWDESSGYIGIIENFTITID